MRPRWALRLLLGLVVLLVIVLAGAFLLVQTPFGKRQLAGMIESLARTPDFQIAIGGIDGFVPSDTVFTNVEIRDAEGVWLTIDRAELAWSPAALLRRDLAIRSITADTVKVLRLPGGGPASAAAPGFRLPSLPVDLQLDAIRIEELDLAPPVTGTQTRLHVEGAGALGAPSSGLDATLKIDKLSGTPGALALAIHYVPSDQTLTVDVSATEQEGGVIAGLLGIPGRPPVGLTVKGSGPLDDWRGTLHAEAGTVAALDGTAAVRAGAEGGRQFTAALDGAVAALLPPQARAFAGDRTRLTATGTIGDGTLVLSDLTLDAAGGHLGLSGPVDLDARTLDLAYQLTEGQSGVLSTLVPGLSYRSLTWSGRISGSFDQPALAADIVLADAALGPAHVAEAALTLGAQPTRALGDPQMMLGFDIEGRLEGTALDTAPAGVAALLQPAATLAVKGEAGLNGVVSADRLVLTLPAATLTAGDLHFDAATLDAEAAVALAVPDLGALAPVAGRPLGGTAALDGTAAFRDGEIALAIGGTLENPATGQPAIDRLLGHEATLALAASGSPGSIVTLDKFSLAGERASIAADGVLQGSDIAAGARIALADASAVAPQLSGPLTIDADLSGPLDQPTAGATISVAHLAYGGRAVDQARLDVTLHDFASPAGTLDFAATVEGLPAAARSGFALAEAGAMRFEGFRLDLASLSLSGDLAVTPERTATGVLSGTVASLADFAALAGQPLAGSATLRATLSGASGRQDVGLDVALSGLSAAGAVRAAGARLTGTVTDVLGAPTADLDLDGRQVVLGGQTFGRLAVHATGTPPALDIAAQGQTGELSFQGRGQVALGEGQTTVQLAALEGRFRDEPFRLAGPATIRQDAGGLAVDGVALTLRQGRVAVGGTLGSRLALQATLTAVPLALAEIAAPDLGLEGTLDGTIELAGTPADPSGRFSLAASGVSLPQSRRSGFAAFAAQLDGRLGDGALTVTGQVSSTGLAPIAIDARVPVRISPGGLPSLAPGAPLTAELRGQVDLALVNDLLAAGADRVTGTADIDLRVQGTASRLDGSGRLLIQNASYENTIYGVRLSNIQAELDGAGDRLVLTRLAAETPDGGQVAGSGQITLSPELDFPVNASLTLTHALLLNTPQYVATASAGLRLTGAMLAQPSLTGQIRVDEAQIDISQQGSSALPALRVEEVNVPAALQAQAERIAATQTAAASGPTFGATLDLQVDAPARIYITGRGLDAELSGQIAVTGTTSEPRLNGVLTMRQGTFDLLGNTLTFERGTLTFLGGEPPDPRLDFVATTTAADASVQVAVTGRASQPDIELTSTPTLPQDEILARLLFGRATGDLSPLQAVQLAQSAAQLAGFSGGTSMLSDIRQNLGLDRLDLDVGQEGQDAVSLTVGKYLGEDLYVGLQQGVGSLGQGVSDSGGEGDTRAEVEFQATDNIKVQGSVGTGGADLGVYMEWEY